MSLFAFQDIVTSVTGIVLLIAMAMAIRVSSIPAIEQAETNATQGELQEQLTVTENRIQNLQNEVLLSDSTLSIASSTGAAGAVEEELLLDSEINRLESGIEELKAAIKTRKAQIHSLQESLASAKKTQLNNNARKRISELENSIKRLQNSNRILFNAPADQGKDIYLVELFPNRLLAAKVGMSSQPKIFSENFATTNFLRWAEDKPRASRFVLFSHPGTTKQLGKIRQGLDSAGRSIGFDLLPDGTTVIDTRTGAQ